MDNQRKKQIDNEATETAIKEFTELSGKGDSSGRKFEREEIHQREKVRRNA